MKLHYPEAPPRAVVYDLHMRRVVCEGRFLAEIPTPTRDGPDIVGGDYGAVERAATRAGRKVWIHTAPYAVTHRSRSNDAE